MRVSSFLHHGYNDDLKLYIELHLPMIRVFKLGPEVGSIPSSASAALQAVRGTVAARPLDLPGLRPRTILRSVLTLAVLFSVPY